jgi:threonine dehydrogenase-like Zn-dependent dehydrogenase
MSLFMPSIRIIRSIGVEAPGQLYFFSYEEGPPPEGHFRLETLYTGLSAGTELTFYKATNPYLHSRWDDHLGVFHAGEPSTRLPVPFLGYMEVGRVIESRVAGVEEGQLVCMAYGHKTGHTANAAREFYLPLPPDIPPILGIYAAQMGPICANGILHAAADWVGPDVRDLYEGVRGRNVLITGAGVVGLLTGLFARLGGASAVAVADRTPERLEAARKLGMIAIDENETEAWRYCKERWHQNGGERGVDVVFQCRAHAASLQTALRSLRPQGTVIDLAFYQGGADEVHLGEEFHHNGLAIRCAQINRVPRGLAHRWTRHHLASATLDLLRAYGCEIRQHLITDIVPFNQSPALFEDLAQHRRNVLQAVFKVFDE